MWRVDDPVGNRIDMFGGGVVRNIPLRPGGHINYWKDPDVIRSIIALIEEQPVTAATRDDIAASEAVVGAPAVGRR